MIDTDTGGVSSSLLTGSNLDLAVDLSCTREEASDSILELTCNPEAKAMNNVASLRFLLRCPNSDTQCLSSCCGIQRRVSAHCVLVNRTQRSDDSWWWKRKSKNNTKHS